MLENFYNYVCYFIFYKTGSILSFFFILSDSFPFCVSSTTYCAGKMCRHKFLYCKIIRIKNVQLTLANLSKFPINLEKAVHFAQPYMFNNYKYLINKLHRNHSPPSLWNHLPDMHKHHKASWNHTFLSEH